MRETMLVGREIKKTANLIGRTLDAQGHRQYVESITGTNSWIICFLARNSGRDIYQKDLEDHFLVRRSTVSAILKRMEEKGIVERHSVEEDKRLKKLVLTPRGMELHELLDGDMYMIEEQITRGITEEELDIFLRVLGKIRGNLKQETSKS